MAVFPSDSIRTKNWGTEILTDSDLEAQLDLLHSYFQAALNSTTGHSHDGTSNQGPKLTTLGTLAATLALNFAKGADTASATTTDLGAISGNYCDVTGTTTITGLGTVQAGTWRAVRFTGALTLTHNGTSLMLPSAANITTASGDTAVFVSLGSGNWKCLVYQRYDGTAITGANASTALVGSTIQTFITKSSAVATTTGTAVHDDTIPTLTECPVVSALNTAITASSASNTLIITAVLNLAANSLNVGIASLFLDAATDAIAAVAFEPASDGYPFTTVIQFSIAPADTSAHTYKIGIGGVSGAAFTVNGTATARKLGGVQYSSVKIEEIKG